MVANVKDANDDKREKGRRALYEPYDFHSDLLIVIFDLTDDNDDNDNNNNNNDCLQSYLIFRSRT